MSPSNNANPFFVTTSSFAPAVELGTSNMVQGYYTLEEAARILAMDPDKLSQMAQRRQIRAFADRGTWRFRTQDVHELARQSGMGSDPELQLGEAPHAKPPVDQVFDFSLTGDTGSSDEHPIVIDSPSGSKVTSKPATPVPSGSKPGSDSDVHLIFDVTDDLIITNDSDVKLEDAGPKTAKPSSSRKIVKTGDSPARSDSGVRLVPMEEPTSVPARQPTPSDSDIRLEPLDSRKGSEARATDLTTEEINLDEELRKQEAARTKLTSGKGEPGEHLVFGVQDEGRPAPHPKTPAPGRNTGKETQLQSGDDDAISLGEVASAGNLTGATSGINLHSPADSGINLAKSGDSSDESLEFELSLDEKQATPKPAKDKDKDDSSGEFELTLDEGGGLAPIDDEHGESQGSGEKDIFETDFDMPGLDEESGSEAVALEEADTDLESSDFDLTMGEEETGSQVVALEEGEADEGAATVARRHGRGGLDDDDVGELEAVDEDEEEAIAPRRAAGAAAPAAWGALPFALMAPTVIVMFLASFMSFELLHGMWGYQTSNRAPGVIVKKIAEMFEQKIPD